MVSRGKTELFDYSLFSLFLYVLIDLFMFLFFHPYGYSKLVNFSLYTATEIVNHF